MARERSYGAHVKVILAALVACSATHEAFGRAWRYRVMEPPRECLRKILGRNFEQSTHLPLEDTGTGVVAAFGRAFGTGQSRG